MQPILLPPNQLHRFYRGGSRIAGLRKTGNTDPYAPEEWIASMASPFGEPGVGVSPLPDGRSLADAVAGEPEAFVGPDHAEAFGSDVAVLIKLLDAGERLPVHFHPDDAFAARHLGSRYGKTEAWIILEADPGAVVHLGFAREVTFETVAGWVESQDAAGMLEGLRAIPVAAGDTIFVPAGTPHAIGEGIFLAELQQPTDFSVLMEWTGFAVDDPEAGHLGLGFERALQGLDTSVWDDDALAWASTTRAEAGDVEALFPPEADRFFRAQRIRPSATRLEAAFSVLIVIDGSPRARGDTWEVVLTRGDALLVPYAAGPVAIDGGGEILRCMPPKPGSGT